MLFFKQMICIAAIAAMVPTSAWSQVITPNDSLQVINMKLRRGTGGVVTVRPGTYEVSNPVRIPDGTTLRGSNAANRPVFRPSNSFRSDSTLFVMGAGARLEAVVANGRSIQNIVRVNENAPNGRIVRCLLRNTSKDMVVFDERNFSGWRFASCVFEDVDNPNGDIITGLRYNDGQAMNSVATNVRVQRCDFMDAHMLFDSPGSNLNENIARNFSGNVIGGTFANRNVFRNARTGNVSTRGMNYRFNVYTLSADAPQPLVSGLYFEEVARNATILNNTFRGDNGSNRRMASLNYANKSFAAGDPRTVGLGFDATIENNRFLQTNLRNAHVVQEGTEHDVRRGQILRDNEFGAGQNFSLDRRLGNPRPDLFN